MRPFASTIFPHEPVHVSEEERNIFFRTLEKTNRWVILADKIPWDLCIRKLSMVSDLSKLPQGITPRMLTAAFIIKYRLRLSSRATVQVILENHHFQYFCQAGKFFGSPPLSAEVLRNIRDSAKPEQWMEFRKYVVSQSIPSLDGKIRFSIRRGISAIRHKVLDALYTDEGDQLNINSGTKWRSRKKASAKLKKKVKRALDVVIWTILVILVCGSLVLILQESDMHFKKEKKTPKSPQTQVVL